MFREMIKSDIIRLGRVLKETRSNWNAGPN
jgi:hypothetical protein